MQLSRLARSLPLLALACCSSFGGTWALAQAVVPAPQIVNPVNETDLVTLKGNKHPFANARNDRGPVSPELPMTDLILVLSRAPEQQAAFDRFVASQYDPDSQNFHQWLSPEEVGLDFGPSPVDVATVSNWLAGHGFAIGEVSKDRMSIRFSGTAGQVESAFHTEIHHLEVKGVRHIGNMSDPRIPAASSRGPCTGRAASLRGIQGRANGGAWPAFLPIPLQPLRQGARLPGHSSASAFRPAMAMTAICLKMLPPTTLLPFTTFFRYGPQAPPLTGLARPSPLPGPAQSTPA